MSHNWYLSTSPYYYSYFCQENLRSHLSLSPIKVAEVPPLTTPPYIMDLLSERAVIIHQVFSVFIQQTNAAIVGVFIKLFSQTSSYTTMKMYVYHKVIFTIFWGVLTKLCCTFHHLHNFFLSCNSRHPDK